jgi:transposase
LAEGVLRERGAAFKQKRPANHSAEQERIAYLEKKIQTKDEVLAELMAEHVALKKEIGKL